MTLRPFLIVGSIVLISISLQPKRTSADSGSPLKKDTVPWSKKMQELYKTLAEVLTDVTSDRRFNDPANKTRIQAEASHLANLVHDLNKKGMVSVDTDPTIPIIAELLGEQTKTAASQLKRGNRYYAQSILRSVPQYCIACHTRNGTGPQFANLPIEPTSKSMSPIELAEFDAATRQFEKAQAEFKKIIQDPKIAETNVRDWETAVHQSLIIAVRVNENPQQAQEIVQTILSTPNAPSFMKEDAKTWIKSIDEWQSERPHRVTTEEGLHSEAIRLMAKARETQKYPMDRTGDIEYLRATAAVHNLLQASPKGEHLSDAYLLAGLSYEVLAPISGESLHEIFYGACIRETPHTMTSQICFRRLEEDVILDYTGSGGSFVPDDVHQSLGELRQLAQPLTTIAPSTKQ